MKHSFMSPRGSALALVVLFLVASMAIWGCSTTDENPVSAEQSAPEVGAFHAKNPAVQSVMAVQNRHTPSLMADPEIIGTATTLTDDANPPLWFLPLPTGPPAACRVRSTACRWLSAAPTRSLP